MLVSLSNLPNIGFWHGIRGLVDTLPSRLRSLQLTRKRASSYTCYVFIGNRRTADPLFDELFVTGPNGKHCLQG
jgi:hypothetical protein